MSARFHATCGDRRLDAGPTFIEAHPVCGHVREANAHASVGAKWLVVQMECKCSAFKMLGQCRVLPVLCARESWDDYTVSSRYRAQ